MGIRSLVIFVAMGMWLGVGTGVVSAENAKVGVNYWPQDGNKVMQYLNEWPNARDVASRDLDAIKTAGFKIVRILFQVQHYGDAYMAWGDGARKIFFQDQGSGPGKYDAGTPVGPPTAEQISNLESYLDLVRSKGLDFEIVMPLQAEGQGGFYGHGETDDMYKRYLDVIFPVVKKYKPNRFYIMGDGVPGQSEDHARWLKNLWPYILDNCPKDQCNLGIEVGGVGSNLWDPTIQNITWIKSNLNVWPLYLGVEFYPSTRTFLCQAGYINLSDCDNLKRMDNIVIDWTRLTNDYWAKIDEAVAGGFLIQIEEMGLISGNGDTRNSDGSVSFNQQDQADFLKVALPILIPKVQSINIWTFEDLVDNGSNDDFGLRRTDKTLKPGYMAMVEILNGRVRPTFAVWLNEYLTGSGRTADMNGDGRVDGIDCVMILRQ